MGSSIDEKEILSQLGKYAVGQGTKYGSLTNGAEVEASFDLVKEYQGFFTLHGTHLDCDR
ncbi:MAG: hypothetical protein ACYC7D_13610 [Nitrososphaerales archaeon]